MGWSGNNSGERLNNGQQWVLCGGRSRLFPELSTHTTENRRQAALPHLHAARPRGKQGQRPPRPCGVAQAAIAAVCMDCNVAKGLRYVCSNPRLFASLPRLFMSAQEAHAARLGRAPRRRRACRGSQRPLSAVAAAAHSPHICAAKVTWRSHDNSPPQIVFFLDARSCAALGRCPHPPPRSVCALAQRRKGRRAANGGVNPFPRDEARTHSSASLHSV